MRYRATAALTAAGAQAQDAEDARAAERAYYAQRFEDRKKELEKLEKRIFPPPGEIKIHSSFSLILYFAVTNTKLNVSLTCALFSYFINSSYIIKSILKDFYNFTSFMGLHLSHLHIYISLIFDTSSSILFLFLCRFCFSNQNFPH